MGIDTGDDQAAIRTADDFETLTGYRVAHDQGFANHQPF
jgi:hypothetical protein